MKLKLAIITACAATSLCCMQWQGQSSEGIKLPKKLRKEWAYIPSGKVVLEKDTTYVDAFYISKTEVTNADYRAFMRSIVLKTTEGKAYEVDSAVWTSATTYGEPYREFYYGHPAYAEYPVIGITYEGALAYCKWQQVQIQNALGDAYQVTCKIPSREEFVRAARGDNHNYVYAWGGPYLFNKQGMGLCNFNAVGDESISIAIGQKTANVYPSATMGVAGHLSDNADITAPIYAYTPNEFGCYNLNGNVAELTHDGKHALGGSWRNSGYDVRCESSMPVQGAASHIGFRTLFRIQRLS
jgi:formylglycine-generating enzyme required for sulfatase activity